ncbi:MAG: hypothetical protein ABF289_01000 [Clostridiales bacterium]
MRKGLIIAVFFSFLIVFFSSCDNLDEKDKKVNTKKNETKIEDNQNKVNSSKNKIQLNSELDQLYDDAYRNFHSGAYNKAIDICDEVLEIQENHYKAYNIKGIALVFSDNFKNGMENIDKSLELEPDDWYLRFNKGLAYSYNKNFDEGLKWYDKSLEKKEYVWSYYGKAAIYGQLNDLDNTIKNLKIAINMSESVIEIARSEKDFDLVENTIEFKELIE